jgi:dihydrofolate synthase/folylpolyglutamate synthase
MTYPEAVARVLALRGGEHAGMRPGLTRIEALLEALGHPEQRFEIVQVGGTNGKGSTAALLAAMLAAAGRRVGLYTSPHLCSLRERIRVNGEPIAEDDVADGVEALGTQIARANATMFEAVTALALDHFARERVEIAVLEVGLGGRLDATTVGRPTAAIITRVDYDHEAYLGSTLAQIAAEKAAIVRGGFAVSAAQPPEVATVIAERARAVGVPLIAEGADLEAAVVARGLDGQVVTLRGPGWALDDARLAMLGRFQASNALLAVATATRLGVPQAAIRNGLARTQWPGRFHVLGRDPLVVLDGAHNPNAARALAEALGEYFGGVAKTLVIGISADKNARGILAPLTRLATRVILTRSSNARATAPADLVTSMPPTAARVETAPTLGEALQLASSPPRTPIVCVAGSLFLIADALLHWAGRPDIPCPMEKGAASICVPF